MVSMKLLLALFLSTSFIGIHAQSNSDLMAEWTVTCSNKNDKNTYCKWDLKKESIECLKGDCEITTSGTALSSTSGITLLNRLVRQSIKMNINHENYGILSITYKEFTDKMECTIEFINLETQVEDSSWVEIFKN